MQNPTSQSVREMISRLRNISHYGGGKVNMDYGFANPDINHCGTPACHGGWYAMACVENGTPITRCANGFIDYEKGADQMSRDLGFNRMYELEAWAQDNPEIWGNSNGMFMFSSGAAFGNQLEQNITIDDILSHWEGVAERLEALEPKDMPAPKPYTFNDARDELRDYVAGLAKESVSQ